MVKINITKTRNAITLPENYATLSEIKSNGDFVYKFRYNIDPIKAFRNTQSSEMASKVLIKIVKNEPKQKVYRLFDEGFTTSTGTGGITKRLLRHKTRQKELTRNIKNQALITKVSDITKAIPNDQTSYILAGKPLTTGTGFLTEAVSTSAISRDNTIAPILDSNLNKTSFTQERGGNSEAIREYSMELLFKKGIDPAGFIGEKSNTIIPAIKQHAGVSSNPSSFSRNSQDTSSNKTATDVLIKSLLTKVEDSFYLSETTNTEKYVNMIKRDTSSLLRIEETIVIPSNFVQSDSFIVQFDLMNSKNILAESVSQVVKHSQLVSLEQTPTVPPDLLVVSSPMKSKNILKIRQRDKNSTSIAIFRKEFNSTRFNFDDEYENIAILNADVGDGEIYFEDKVSSFNPTVYRTIPVSFDGIYGSEFASKVAFGNETKINDEFFKRPKYLVLYHEIENTSGIRLFVDNLPPTATALQIYKRNLTLHEKEFSRYENPVLTSELRPIEFLDKNLKRGHIYEYKCKLYFKDGSELDAGNNLVVDYSPVENNTTTTIFEKLVVDQNDPSGLDVRFDIVNNAVPTDFDSIKTALSSQGITEFDTEIENNKEKLQSLFFTSVTRTNLQNGEIESFGIVKDKTFSDRNLGSIKNIKALKTGRSYKYTLVTYAREAETMFPERRRLALSGSSNEYLLNTYKFYNPITLKQGNIVTDAAFKRNHSKDQFSIGTIVNIQNFNVQFANILPKVTSIKATSFNKKKNLIRWKVDGDTKKIDHFIIILEINEMRTIVGKSHALSFRNEYSFIDTLDNKESGALTYIIVPVYYDYSRGSENRASPLII